MDHRTRILIADDDARVRRSLRELVESFGNVEIVAEAEDGAAAVKAVTLHQPDIALMDIRMPQLNGLEATARLKRDVPHTRVIIISIDNAPQVVRRALGAGARGYVPKDAAPVELEAAIRVISRGGVYIGSHAGGQDDGPGRPGLDPTV